MRVLLSIGAAVVGCGLSLLAGRGGQPDPDATLSLTRARMYALPSATVWRAVPQALKSTNLVLPKTSADDQFVIAWEVRPMNLPKEKRSELRVFVSPFAEPARVYAGSIVRTPSPEDPRTLTLRYNTGELERAFFAALERVILKTGEAIPVAADARAQVAARLLGAVADSDPCLARLREADPPALNPETGFVAPQKIPESDVPPVHPGSKVRDKSLGETRLDATITEDGALVGARLINTTIRDAAFANDVIAAASLWHYRPSRIGGCATPVRMTLAVQFSKK